LLNNKEIHLSKLEFNLLIYLVKHKWKILSKELLLDKVWGEYDEFGQSRTVDVYIWYLRKKLGKNLIKTVRGQGYIIN
jgi:DNA-binding response OmpR family regulator